MWESIGQRAAEIRARIEAAARRAGREPQQVTLIAVTKVLPAEAIRAAYDAGLRHFGENYVQEFERKLPAVADLPGACFHLIGHLQSNKARRAVQAFDVIQTVDSGRLARRLDEAAAVFKPGLRLPVMIEVKLSPEETKSGVPAAELGALVEAVRACPHLELRGLMTMPPFSEDPEDSRPYFRKLRELAEAFGLPELSMGMSQDFEVAIEEGATHVRIGTALFGPREAA
ncbi:MAG: YggS family pyridoxal phosphate-dependent enzyme [Bryobacterales bacterium]|nr:YggS family pyridoxal phosphate-dependent enzyme [Bryobacteraceae bacterium]MDW8130901.1 YggS family pyridoxal phosphate-dependent enzyme [Bryobacterales bacterium]